MPIKLYIDFISQPSRAVLCLCIINKIPVEIIETRISKMEVNFLLFEDENTGVC